jgi:hypothetical protein
MRTRLVLSLGITLLNLMAAACEDDPTDYLKDASTAAVSSGTGGASGESAGTGGESAGTGGNAGTAGNIADAGE